MRILFHFRQGKESADAGHTVDVGEKDGLLFWEKLCPLLGEPSVSFFAAAHFETDEQKFWARSKGEVLLVLVLDGKGVDFVADLVRFGRIEVGADKYRKDGEEVFHEIFELFKVSRCGYDEGDVDHTKARQSATSKIVLCPESWRGNDLR